VKKFEYFVNEIHVKATFASRKLEVEKFNQSLNELGNKGWELVDKITLGELGGTDKIICVFKREIE